MDTSQTSELKPSELLPFEGKETQLGTESKSEAAPDATPIAVTPVKREPIKADQHGVIRGTSFEEQWRMAKAYHSSRLMPKALDTPEKVLVALQLCYELNLPPMTSIGKICVINGTPSIFGDLPMALVMKSGRLQDMMENFFDEKGEKLSIGSPDVYGAQCVVSRKNGPTVVREFSIADAKKAGLWDKSIWKQYSKRMLQLRARSWALKDLFPDVLMGVAIAEYDFNSDGASTSTGEDFASEIDREYGTQVPSDGTKG